MFNLFVVLILTFIFGLVLIYFISSHDRKLRLEQLKERGSKSSADNEIPIDFRQFTKICTDILENLKLEVQDVQQVDGTEVIMKATTSDPITQVEYLVVCFYLHGDDSVGTYQVQAISDQIISERLSKGIIITSGQIDPAVFALPELASMTFIDGTKMMALIKEYKINY